MEDGIAVQLGGLPMIGSQRLARGNQAHGSAEDRVVQQTDGIDYAEVTRPKRAFLQFLNPEILRLYGTTAGMEQQRLYSWTLRLTRYALLASRTAVVLPASYLFEVPFIDRFIKHLQPLRRSGMVQFASPTSDLTAYAEKKRREYREELSLFPDYQTQHVPEWQADSELIWTPRSKRSASTDIKSAWERQLTAPGVIRKLLENRTGNFSPLSRWERVLEDVPQLLDGRAFVQRYVEAVLPFKLEPAERTETSLLISRAYLESYLLELNAFVLAETPLGDLSCGLPTIGKTTGLLRLPYGLLSNLLDLIGVRVLFERRLGWKQIAAITRTPITDWLIRSAIWDFLAPDRPLSRAIIEASFKRRPPVAAPAGSDLSDCFLDAIWNFHSHVGQRADFNITGLDRQATDVINKPEQLLIVDKGERRVNANDVFIVHGRDRDAVASMKSILRAAGINPVEWEEVVQWTGRTSPFTLEVVTEGVSRTKATLILFTPDEEVRIRKELLASSAADPEEGYQPRPNVLVEAGMAFAMNPDRTLILMVGSSRPVSDLAGINYLSFDGAPERRHALLKRLRGAGCEPRETEDFFSIPFKALSG